MLKTNYFDGFKKMILKDIQIFWRKINPYMKIYYLHFDW